MSNDSYNFGQDASNGLNAKKSRSLLFTLITLGVIAVVFLSVAQFITDRMWFESVSATQVFDTLLITKIKLFVLGALLGLVAGFLTIRYSLRNRSAFTVPSSSPNAQSINEVLSKVSKFGTWLVPAVLGLITGSSFAALTEQWLLFTNSQPFGEVDATFGRDISFFVFELPFLRSLNGFLSTIVVLCGLLAVILHYLQGNIRVITQDNNRVKMNFSDDARRQLAVTTGLFLALYAWSYYLDRFSLVLSTNDLITGMKFVDANIKLPALNILAGISLVVAFLFLANVFMKNWALPILGSALLIISSVLIGGVWPGFVQQVQVKLDEQTIESPFIERNIAATRDAYGLSNVNYQSYEGSETVDSAILAKDAATLQNIRLLDPYVASTTFEQLQQLKGFYSFAPTLDVARYKIGGETRGALLAVREINLSGIPESQQNWLTNHLIYTHGIGLAAAYDNTSTVDGQPAFFESDVPPTGLLNVTEPRIYFGEESTQYSIVGGSKNIELDYPDDSKPSGQQNTTYTGKGGVAIGGTLNKLLFAARFGEPNFLLSEQITDNSRVLYNRTPVERVEAVAPWLTLDGDPYAAVIDGRIVWILDGYTTTGNFPYSQTTSLADATSDSFQQRTTDSNINYIRNSVKATVDAYDGTVTLYAWDEQDPILKAWSAIFPGLVQNKSQMSDSLLSQIRYPEDLFKIQRDILRKYHISDPKAFFTGENFWIVPDDPTYSTGGLPQPPYYLNIKMPGDTKQHFQITATFAPAKRPSLAGFMAVNSDFGDDYGKITLLQLPSQTTIPGPVQAQNLFESDATISSQLSLLRQGGSNVVLGNLLSLPVGGGILYVQPIYVESSGAGGFPLLRKVQVGYGQKVVMADTLSSALSQVLGESVEPNPGPDTGNKTDAELLDAALARAQKAYNEGQAALRTNDWAAYGTAQKKLAAAIAEAQRISNRMVMN
ncbi:MAG: UPF0182 family protein [Actinobacteria bacterium]|nr:UPF0182 family protein [Actinomycetota bacterium]